MSTPDLSIQLYTLREHVAADLPGTLQQLAEIGFTCVEPYHWHQDVDGTRRALESAGLTAPSAHADVLGGEHESVFAAAARLGIETVVQPVSPRDSWQTRAGVEALAAHLNELGALARGYGVRLGYHNHAFELEAPWCRPTGADQPPSTALDVLAASLSEDVVLEVDTYWAAVGGADPVALLQRLGVRAALLHVKDGPVTPGADEQQPVGQGSMPVDKILAAAPHARPVVELDDYRGDMLQAVRRSHTYLAGLR